MFENSLGWFICAFFLSLASLLAVRYILNRQEKHRDIKKRLQTLSQDIALGYFQHALKELNSLPHSALYQEEIDILKAQCFKGLGQHSQLISFLQKSSALNPKNSQLQLLLASLYVDSKHYTEALDIYEELPKELLKQHLLPLTRALYARGQYDRCIEWIENYCQQPSGQILHILGNCYFELGRYHLALDYYQKSENLDHKSIEQIEKKAHCLMEMRRFKEALEAWRELFGANAHSDQAILGLSLCLQHQGEFKQALRIYENAPKWLENDSRFQSDLGHCYFHLKNYKKALNHLLNAFEMGDNRPHVLVTCAIALERQRLWSHAQCLYTQLTQEHPKHHAGWAGLAYLYGIGKSENISQETAIEYGNRAVDLYPCLSAWEILSAVYARAGMFDRAHDIQESLSRHQKDDSQKRREAMRILRRHKPLNSSHVPHVMIA